MAGTLNCALTTPEQNVFEGAIRFVVVPATDGELGILPRHAPLVGSLGFGELRLDVEGQGQQSYFVDGGFLQVLGDQVSILAASAVPAEELDAAAEELVVQELTSRGPGQGADLEAREAHARSLGIARARLRLARKAG